MNAAQAHVGLPSDRCRSVATKTEVKGQNLPPAPLSGTPTVGVDFSESCPLLDIPRPGGRLVKLGSHATKSGILRGSQMKRRNFIAGLGAAASLAMRPLAARAQQALPVVGFLNLGPPRPNANNVMAFRQGLAAAGFIEGQTAAIEYLWANNQGERLASLAADFVKRHVAVIVAIDSGPTVFAAQAATSTIPVVFAFAGDPVKFGLVTSLSRPGGNMTGITSISTELTSKRLGLLREMAPLATTLAYLSDPRAPDSEGLTRDALAAARALGRQAIALEARNVPEIELAFSSLVERGASALVVGPYILFQMNASKIVELAARHKIPTIYPSRFFVGGLMSYNADLVESIRQIGSLYVAQILKGAKPADLPVQQPTKFELVINLKTAQSLGLAVPPTLLAIADEVIE
jgi:putative ABC transport system substrate-binding protein